MVIMKRLVCLVLALIMMLSLAVTAFATVDPTEIPTEEETVYRPRGRQYDSPTGRDYYYLELDTEGEGRAISDYIRVLTTSNDFLELSAIDGEGFFTRWIIKGDYKIVYGSLTDAEIGIKLLSDVEAIANFSIEEHFLNMTVDVVTEGHGTADVNIPRVRKGSDRWVTFTAHEKDDVFVEWVFDCDYKIVNGSLTSKSVTIIPYTDVHATAYLVVPPEPNPDNGSTSPKTGDALPYVAVIMLMALAGAVIAFKKLREN